MTCIRAKWTQWPNLMRKTHDVCKLWKRTPSKMCLQKGSYEKIIALLQLHRFSISTRMHTLNSRMLVSRSHNVFLQLFGNEAIFKQFIFTVSWCVSYHCLQFVMKWSPHWSVSRYLVYPLATQKCEGYAMQLSK